VHIGPVYVVDLTEEARKKDLEKVFMKYGPLKEIWLASYAPIYAFVVFRNRLDAQVLGSSFSIFQLAGRTWRVLRKNLLNALSAEPLPIATEARRKNLADFLLP
jgi:hypothetical protein